jgi:hypothetical protein
MAKNKEKMLAAFNRDFPTLTEENKSSVLAMTKFLVLAQNAVIPSMPDSQEENENKKRNNGRMPVK